GGGPAVGLTQPGLYPALSFGPAAGPLHDLFRPPFPHIRAGVGVGLHLSGFRGVVLDLAALVPLLALRAHPAAYHPGIAQGDRDDRILLAQLERVIDYQLPVGDLERVMLRLAHALEERQVALLALIAAVVLRVVHQVRQGQLAVFSYVASDL